MESGMDLSCCSEEEAFATWIEARHSEAIGA